MTSEQRGPVSWEALAAEFAAGRPDGEPADAAAWDAVAAALAARVADRPAVVDEPPALPAVDPPEPDAEPEAEREPDPEPENEPAAEPDREPESDPATVCAGIEALLFVLDGPVDVDTLAAAVRCSVAQAAAALAELAAEYDRRGAGITLHPVGEGWRIYTRDEFAGVIERYLGHGRGSRLSQAALETLAVIAYRQPVTRARVAAVRGVSVDGVMRTLLARGLVHEVGVSPDSGGALYGTTPLFLERLGLTGLDELPDLGPLMPETAALLAERPDAGA